MRASRSASVAIPALADDDLKDKQRRVEQQIDHAHDDLEHSSKAVRRASAALVNAQAQLRDARDELAVVRDKLAAARETDARMQIELTGARHELILATVELAEGAYAVDLQQGEVKDTVTRFYTEGDPRLQAFASYIDAKSPSDLMRRMATEKAVVGHQTSVYADLDEAEDAARRPAGQGGGRQGQGGRPAPRGRRPPAWWCRGSSRTPRTPSRRSTSSWSRAGTPGSAR